MRLAEGGRAVAVEPQHLGQRGDAVRPLPGLAGEGGRGLGDRAHVADVVVAAGQQGRAGRRAERRGVELVVPQPVLRQLLAASACGSARRRRSDWPKPMSSIRTIRTFGALAGALTWNRGGALALRASSVVIGGELRLRDRQDRAVELVPSPGRRPRSSAPSPRPSRGRGLACQSAAWPSATPPASAEDAAPCHRSTTMETPRSSSVKPELIGCTEWPHRAEGTHATPRIRTAYNLKNPSLRTQPCGKRTIEKPGQGGRKSIGPRWKERSARARVGRDRAGPTLGSSKAGQERAGAGGRRRASECRTASARSTWGDSLRALARLLDVEYGFGPSVHWLRRGAATSSG